METIIPANETIPTLCVFGRTPDMLGPQLIHVSILAWAITRDGALPITPLGRCEPGGAWLVRDVANNFICSDGTTFRDQYAATDWLRSRSIHAVAA